MSKQNPKILILGALGQIGTELTIALREKYGVNQVFTSDIRSSNNAGFDTGQHIELDIMDDKKLHQIIGDLKITQIYHLAAILSAKGEENPRLAWDINMNGLLNVLQVAVEAGINKIFWPSSIAIFGKRTPIERSQQYTVTDPHTIYGISKLAGERWCHYYHYKKGLDIRSLRYPGIISYKGEPGGGTTDWAVEVFYEAIKYGKYECFLEPESCLPYMYMPDAVKSTIMLMDVPKDRITVHSSYNIGAMSFTPEDLAHEIRKYLPSFEISYKPDFRREIARNWPASINDEYARTDFNWQPQFDLEATVKDMMENVAIKLKQEAKN